MKFLNCLVFYVRQSFHPSLQPYIYFLIYKISSIPTHFPRHMLGVFPWVWNDLNNVAQTVCRKQRIPGQRVETPVTNHKSFVLWVVLFCGCEFTATLLLPGDPQNQPPINCTWNRSRICFLSPWHLQQLWLFHVILLLFITLFILISVMSLWWLGPVHLHTIRHFIGQL